MIGATAKSEQFQTRSGSEATKGSRKGFSLLGGGVDPVSQLSEFQKTAVLRKSLIARMSLLNNIKREQRLMMVKTFGQGDTYFAAREKLNQATAEVAEIVEKLSEIKHRGNCPPGLVPQHFVDVAREMLTKGQFQLIFNEAANRAKKGHV